MEVILGKYAGFCYGVSTAILKTKKLAKNTEICSYGELINNKIVVNELEKEGVKVISSLGEAKGRTVVIRSHGVPPKIYKELEEKNIKYEDCTCQDVKKVQLEAKKAGESGKTVIIAGDKNHPEVVGIKGFAGEKVLIFNSLEELEIFEANTLEKYVLIAQTTFSKTKFQKMSEILRVKVVNFEVKNTICPVMVKRQEEAENISKIANKMLVIGDKLSSNTNKLWEICKKNCENTYLIESIRDLELNIFSTSDKIGIVAGASTPPDIIKEAFLTMSSLDNANTNQSFEEMLNESFITLHTGDIVKGTVIAIANAEISVNLGFKSDGLIPRSEYSDDPNADPSKDYKPGDEIEVFVVRVNDGEGNVLLSKKKIDSKRNFDLLETAFEEKTPLQGKVIEVIRGGVIALIKGVRVFIPSSQVSNRFVEDLNSLKGKEFNFEIIDFDKTKRRIVGGRKALATREEKETKDKLFSQIEVGQQLEGTVNRLVNFGAFVDIGGVDGLIHISQLSWGRVKKVTDVLNEGDKVKVTILEIDREKERISLSLKDISQNPWDSIEEKYPVGKIVGGKVVRLAAFGAFVELEPGVDGLVHISQIAAKHVVKPEDELTIGQVIEVKIMEVNKEESRISLSKKEADGVNVTDEVKEEKAAEEIEEKTE